MGIARAERGCLAGGCLAGLFVGITVLSLMVAFPIMLTNALPLPRWGERPDPPDPFEPIGCDGPITVETASVRNLCAGPSDAARLERAIRSVKPSSPLVSHAATIIGHGQRTGVDPLLLLQWQLESQLATDPNAANGGGLTWAAAAPYAARWGCGPGSSVRYPTGEYVFTRCPSLTAELGLWFDYVSGRYPLDRYPTLALYAETYNPCGAPGNEHGRCGRWYAQQIVNLVLAYAGAPSAPPTVACPPQRPIVHAESAAALARPPGLLPIERRLFGGANFPITQGWGWTELAGEPAYLGYPHFHQGLDWAALLGTPVTAPAAGRVTEARADGGRGLTVMLVLDNGVRLRLMHLSTLPPIGPVAAGGPLGRVGSTGYSTGPHLHVQVHRPDGSLAPPEHWACVLDAAPTTSERTPPDALRPTTGARIA